MTAAPPFPSDAPAATTAEPCGRLAALLLLAAAVRGLALWQYGYQLLDDPDDYATIARTLAAGQGFGYPTPLLEGIPTAYRPPLYPLLLAPLYGISGAVGVRIPWLIGVMQLLLGVATVWLTALTARRLDLGRAGLLAPLVVACDPLLVYNTALVMTETTATFLAALMLWLTMRMSSGQGRFFAGVAFGLCCLCRPTFWAFGGLVVLGWLIRHWPGRRSIVLDSQSEHFEWPQKGMVVALGTLLAAGPWVWRNQQTLGRPVVTTTHGGYTLLLAHNPVYTDEVVNRPWGAVISQRGLDRLESDIDRRLWVAYPGIRMGVRTHTPEVDFARDEWMYREALAYMSKEPLTAFKAGLTLVGRLWNIVPMETQGRAVPVPAALG